MMTWSTTYINSDSSSSGDINRYSGGEVRSGYERESPIQERLSPFTGEEYYTHATQDEDHGIRNVGPEIGAIGKNYTRREFFFYKFWINDG